MDVIINEYCQIPAVTRAYCTACFLTSLAVKLEIVSPLHLYYNSRLITSQCQVWRLATCFTFVSELGLDFAFCMMFVYGYCRMLEESSFHGRTGDFVFMMLFCSLIVLIGGACLSLAFLCYPLMIAFVYLWCRRNSYVQLNILGLLTFRAPYLPWLILALSFLLGGTTAASLLGIFAGHLYYFLEDVFPRLRHGFKVLQTPSILRTLFDDANEEIGAYSLPERELVPNRDGQDAF